MIYAHIPFCRSFCTYCDFYSEVARQCRAAEDIRRQESLFDRFGEALTAEVKARKDELQSVCTGDGVNTLYIGGGTPSVLPPAVYERLISALKEVGVEVDFDEFTFEVNPEDIVEKGEVYVEDLLRLGVNRISMGVQSFDDGILKWMNRRHTAETAVKAYGILENAGVENISIDLIFGLPQLSDSLWQETLDKALDISSGGHAPKHISSYQLSVEPGSMLARLLEKGRWNEASDEQCRRQYDMLCETLGGAGYHHYEISNFALPGYEAVHNSAYWRHVPYAGLGPGAHSCFRPLPCPDSSGARTLIRQWNEDSLERYLESGARGDFSIVQGQETLDKGQIAMEKVMLGLRTSAGLPEDVLRECCGDRPVDQALDSGDLIRSSFFAYGRSFGGIRIPEDRFFVSDRIISDLV